MSLLHNKEIRISLNNLTINNINKLVHWKLTNNYMFFFGYSNLNNSVKKNSDGRSVSIISSLRVNNRNLQRTKSALLLTV